MKKYNYISFSLWSDKPIYNVGIIKNIRLAKDIYASWKIIIYYDDTVPVDTIVKLNEAGVDLVNMTGISYGMFWRFFAADLPDCERAIFRDCDSRLTIREKLAVDEWIKSEKAIHIMRDHPYHKIPYGVDSLSILGGMWGIKGNVIPMKKMIEKFTTGKELGYGVDQAFLMKIYTLFKNEAKVHDEFFSNAPFPLNRESYSFIGERIDENDTPVGNDREVISQYYYNKKLINKVFSLIKKYIKATVSKF